MSEALCFVWSVFSSEKCAQDDQTRPIAGCSFKPHSYNNWTPNYHQHFNHFQHLWIANIFSFHLNLSTRHGTYLVVFRSKLKCLFWKQLSRRFGSGVFSSQLSGVFPSAVCLSIIPCDVFPSVMCLTVIYCTLFPSAVCLSVIPCGASWNMASVHGSSSLIVRTIRSLVDWKQGR